jgi:hypothetical protein
VPPADELPGPPVSEDAFGGQSLLLADAPVEGLVDALPPALPLLGAADWLPGGQSAALEAALGELAVAGSVVDDVLDCAIAAVESASSALAVAAASKLRFMLGLLSGKGATGRASTIPFRRASGGDHCFWFCSGAASAAVRPCSIAIWICCGSAGFVKW